MKKSDGDSKTRVPSDEEILRTTTTAAFRLPDLLMRGGSPSARSPTHPFQTVLHIAVQQKENIAVLYLLKHGADIDATDADGFTPLHIAAKNGDSSSCHRLIESAADINATTSDGRTPLMLAAAEGHKAIVTRLLHAGADRNVGAKGNRAADIALTKEIRSMINSCDREPLTVDDLLLKSVRAGLKTRVKSLIQRGASVNCIEKSSEEYSPKLTPLHIAVCHNNSTEVAELLLTSGANVNARARGGATPLHMASSRGDAKLVRLLLDHGADRTLRQGSFLGLGGDTPADIVANREVLEVLNNYHGKETESRTPGAPMLDANDQIDDDVVDESFVLIPNTPEPSTTTTTTTAVSTTTTSDIESVASSLPGASEATAPPHGIIFADTPDGDTPGEPPTPPPMPSSLLTLPRTNEESNKSDHQASIRSDVQARIPSRRSGLALWNADRSRCKLKVQPAYATVGEVITVSWELITSTVYVSDHIALFREDDRDLLFPLTSAMLDSQKQGTVALPTPPVAGQYVVVFVRYPPIEEAPPIPYCFSSVGPVVIRPQASSNSKVVANTVLQHQSNTEKQVREGRLQVALDWTNSRRLRAAASESNKLDGFSLKEWLSKLDLSQYYDSFVSHGFADRDVNLLPSLTEDDLTALGISMMAHRRRFIAYAQTLLIPHQAPPS